MDHFRTIYSSRAAEYHRMIAVEDVEGNIARIFRQHAPWAGRRVLDLGTGTGRLPLLLAAEARCLLGVDLHFPMLRENKNQRARSHLRWDLLCADMRCLPLPSGWAELTTAGWAIGHLRGWYPDWQHQIGRVLSEMHRLTVPGGRLVILETLGTGSLEPAPPAPGLAEYSAWLEQEWGFTRHTIRTDYQFNSVEQAVAHTEFFFGPGLAAQIRARNWSRLPEWTGVWIKSLESER